jgi:L-alanine-DL-glutamate epimerase-like enolase superfamily enzyme
VDANQGYDEAETVRFFPDTAALDLEFLEQPLPADAVETMRRLPEEAKERIAADESLLDERDALRLAAPRACGIFNIKLMKCGGIEPALRIAAIAETAGVALMWGCMDESVIGIAAALHAALASPATRYLDLDGSLDLARDVARGGFVLEEGILRTTSAPGLGVSPL